MNWKVYVACNFNCCIITEELLKITGSHVQCKSGNMSDIVHDRDVVTRDQYNKQ